MQSKRFNQFAKFLDTSSSKALPFIERSLQDIRANQRESGYPPASRNLAEATRTCLQIATSLPVSVFRKRGKTVRYSTTVSGYMGKY